MRVFFVATLLKLTTMHISFLPISLKNLDPGLFCCTLSSSLGLGKDLNDNTEVISAVQIHEGEVSGQSEVVQAVCTPTPGSHVDLAVPVVTLDIDDFVSDLPDHVLANIPMPQPPQKNSVQFSYSA